MDFRCEGSAVRLTSLANGPYARAWWIVDPACQSLVCLGGAKGGGSRRRAIWRHGDFLGARRVQRGLSWLMWAVTIGRTRQHEAFVASEAAVGVKLMFHGRR